MKERKCLFHKNTNNFTLFILPPFSESETQSWCISRRKVVIWKLHVTDIYISSREKKTRNTKVLLLRSRSLILFCFVLFCFFFQDEKHEKSVGKLCSLRPFGQGIHSYSLELLTEKGLLGGISLVNILWEAV